MSDNDIPTTETPVTLASQSPVETPDSVSQTVDTATDMNQPAPPKPLSMRKKKNIAKQQKKFGKLMATWRKAQMKRQGRVTRQLKDLSSKIGHDDFEALKAMVTTFYPEKKDDKGVVVQEAYNSVNYAALIVEAKNFLVLRRERRMSGYTTENPETKEETYHPPTRKRSTGRTSDRKAHRNTYNYILERGKKAVENNEEISTLKV